MKGLIKDAVVQVLLTSEELRQLDRLVKIEKARQTDMRIGRGTVLRQLALPQLKAALETADV